MSSRMRSGTEASSVPSAASPSGAETTPYPARSSVIVRIFRTVGLSSTTMTVRFALDPLAAGAAGRTGTAGAGAGVAADGGGVGIGGGAGGVADEGPGGGGGAAWARADRRAGGGAGGAGAGTGRRGLPTRNGAE